ncbi:MAG: Ig-like domain-containing protein, partial [Clostridia bacterium]|nr:Ig-like domain-containing protein [Clostridia bacterium]
MKLSKKLKTKLKKNTTIALTSIALVTTTLAALKLADISMPVNTISLLESDNKTSATTINRLPNTETVTYIYDVSDLVAFRDAVNAGDNYSGKTVYLMEDIDLSSVCSSTLGNWTPIGIGKDSDGNTIKFSGTFDGRYHRIVNLYYKGNTYQNVGFFSSLPNTGVIQNVLFDNVYLYNTFAMYKENSSTGSACGNSTGSIRNCGVNSGTITGRNTVATNQSGSYLFAIVGGVVGSGSNIIDGCYNKASVISQNTVTNQTYQGGAYAGGIIGSMGKGTISNCYNMGAINSTGRYGYRAGIAGAASSTVSTSAIAIKNCYNIGTLSGSGTAENYTAAISARIGDWNGKTYTSFTNCYRISSTSYIYIKGKSGVAGTAFNTTYTATMGNSYAYDIYGINNGYPVLAWQNETTVMSLNKNQAYIGVGESLSLNVVEKDEITELIGENYAATNFTWTSTNEDVATVNENGIVTGIADGYTTVYAYHETSGLYAMCVVNVAKGIANPQIETGNGFTVILKADGTVWTIGNNVSGMLGNGTT